MSVKYKNRGQSFYMQKVDHGLKNCVWNLPQYAALA